MASKLSKLDKLLSAGVEFAELGRGNRNVTISVAPSFARECIAELQSLRDRRYNLQAELNKLKGELACFQQQQQ